LRHDPAVEQNARMALQAASYGYIMESGKVVLDGTSGRVVNNEDVKEFYLGGGGERAAQLQEPEELQAPQEMAVSLSIQ
jgi:hypothetical protein